MKKREVMQGTMWLFPDSREWGSPDSGLGIRGSGIGESRIESRESGLGIWKPEAGSQQPTADNYLTYPLSHLSPYIFL